MVIGIELSQLGGGKTFFAGKYMYEKLTKSPNFMSYLPEKTVFLNFGVQMPPCLLAYAQPHGGSAVMCSDLEN